METDLDRWLDIFSSGAASLYQWELTGGGWLRTRTDSLSGCWCPLQAQWVQARPSTGGNLMQCNSWQAGEQQGLSVQGISELMRAADHNPTGYDATLRARLLHLCHVEESSL